MAEIFELAHQYFVEQVKWNSPSGDGVTIPRYIVCKDAEDNYYTLTLTLKASVSTIGVYYNKWRALFENETAAPIEIKHVWVIGETSSASPKDTTEVQAIFEDASDEADDSIVNMTLAENYDDGDATLFTIDPDGVYAITWQWNYLQGEETSSA